MINLNRGDLDRMAAGGCQAPGCRHDDHAMQVFFHGRCHMAGRLEVSYRYRSGEIVIGCMECHKDVARVAVADPQIVESDDAFLNAGQVTGLLLRLPVEAYEAAAANPALTATNAHLLRMVAGFRRQLAEFLMPQPTPICAKE